MKIDALSDNSTVERRRVVIFDAAGRGQNGTVERRPSLIDLDIHRVQKIENYDANAPP